MVVAEVVAEAAEVAVAAVASAVEVAAVVDARDADWAGGGSMGWGAPQA
jgi:1,6-anhydro-N-acetylmuramate kinase